jgi:hypothetical protein
MRLLVDESSKKKFQGCAYPESSSLEPPEADEHQLSSRPKLAIKAA